MEKVVPEDKKFFSDMPYKTTLNPAGPAAWSHFDGNVTQRHQQKAA